MPVTRHLLAALLIMAALAAKAEDAALPTLSLDLNTAADTDGGCRLTFLADNRLGGDLSALVFETVFIRTDGLVDRLTLLDFRDLPEGRTRARQFDLPGLTCDRVGRVLLNAASTCTGAGVDPAACMAGLRLTSRTGIEVAG